MESAVIYMPLGTGNRVFLYPVKTDGWKVVSRPAHGYYMCILHG